MSALRLAVGVMYAMVACIGILLVFLLLATVVATKGLILIPFVVIFGGGYLIAKYFVDEDDF